MGSRSAPDDLDEVLDAILPAIPPEHHDAMRTLLRPSRRSRKRSANRHPTTPPHDAANADAASPASPASSPTPIPPITPERATRIADDIILAAMRAAGVPLNTPLALRTGRGAGGEGPKSRIAVRPDRAPLGHTVRLSDVAPESLRWLWPGRIPAGKITVLDGDPGLGKSTLVCEVAARLSRGDALPGDEAEPSGPRGVLLFSAEDDVHDTIRPRIDAAGGDPGRIVAFVAVPDGSESGRPFALPRDLPLLEAVVTRVDAALVVFDPLVAYLPAGVSPNSDQHVRHAMAALKASAERTGAAIVVVRHLTKSLGANPLYRGAGSIGIIAAARSGLLLAADPDDPARRILALAKGNLARPAASLAFRLEEVPGSHVARVVWDGESPWTATQLLHVPVQAVEDGDETRSVIAETRAWLREALADGPRPALELRYDAASRALARRPSTRRANSRTSRPLKNAFPGAAGFGCSCPVPRTTLNVKMAPRPAPEMFAIFAIFAIFAKFAPTRRPWLQRQSVRRHPG